MAKECFDELRKLMPDEVNDSTIRKHIADVRAIRDELGDLPTLGDYQTKINKMIEDRKNLLQSERLERANNIRKKQANIKHIFQDDFEGNRLEGLRSLLDSGTGFLSKGGNRGVSRLSNNFRDRWLTRLTNGLEDSGVLEVLKTGDLDKEIMMELFELKQGGNPGLSKNVEALAAAKVIRGVQTDIVKSLRLAGSDIGEVPGYIMKQSHNGELVGKKSFEEWAEEIMPLLDHEKTFGLKSGDRGSVKKVMTKIYEDIVTGRKDIADTKGVSDELITINKTSKLGNKVSRSRALHFKDGESFFKYNSEFGKATLAESLLSSINQNSRNTALIEVFGTNPAASLEALIKRAENSLVDRPNELVKLQGGLKQLRNALELEQGTTTIPGRNIGAKIGSGVRAVNAAALLGGSALRAITDLGPAAANLRSSTGKGFLDSYSESMMNFFRSVKPKDKKRAAELFGIHINDTLGEIHNRFDVTSNFGSGKIAKGHAMVMKLTGLPWQSTTARISVARTFSHELGGNAKKTFSSLDARLQASLERVGIDAFDWSILRRTADDIGFNQKGLTPEGFVKNVTDDQIIEYMKAKGIKGAKGDKLKLERIKFDLENKIGAYLTDNAEVGSPTPGSRTRNFVLRGTQEGTLEGEVWRTAFQFKSFILQMHHVTQRVGLSNPNARAKTLLFGKQKVFRAGGREDIQNLAALMASMTVLGYAGQAATDVSKGITPKDPTDPDTWMDSFIRGGAGGIYADFILGEYDKSYRNLSTDLLGPTARKADQIASILAKVRKGKGLSSSDFKILEQSIPGQNLFYLRGALDYLILKNMQEAINPGTLRRAEKRLKKKGQRTFVQPIGR